MIIYESTNLHWYYLGLMNETSPVCGVFGAVDRLQMAEAQRTTDDMSQKAVDTLQAWPEVF